MTVELKSRLWVDHRSEKWTNNRPIKIEAIPLTSGYPKYFEPFLKPKHSVYKNHKS